MTMGPNLQRGTMKPMEARTCCHGPGGIVGRGRSRYTYVAVKLHCVHGLGSPNPLCQEVLLLVAQDSCFSENLKGMELNIHQPGDATFGSKSRFIQNDSLEGDFVLI